MHRYQNFRVNRCLFVALLMCITTCCHLANAGEKEIKSDGASDKNWVVHRQSPVYSMHGDIRKHIEVLTECTLLPTALCRLIAKYTAHEKQKWHYKTSCDTKSDGWAGPFVIDGCSYMLEWDIHSICFISIDTAVYRLMRIGRGEGHIQSATYLPKKRKLVAGIGHHPSYRINMWHGVSIDCGSVHFARVQSSEAHTKDFLYLNASCDEDILASSSQDGTICLWHVETGHLLHKIEDSYGMRIGWSMSEKHLFYQTKCGLNKFDAQSGKIVDNLAISDMYRFEVMQDHDGCVVYATQDALVLYNFVTKKEEQRLKIEGSKKNQALRVSPQGRFVGAIYFPGSGYSPHEQNYLYLWEPSAGPKASCFSAVKLMQKIAFGSENTLFVRWFSACPGDVRDTFALEVVEQVKK